MGEGSRKQHNDWLYDMLIPSLFIQRNGYVYLYFIRDSYFEQCNKLFLIHTPSILIFYRTSIPVKLCYYIPYFYPVC